MGTRLQTGDVFSVSLNSTTKKYFQYLGKDQTMLDSDVIRAFKKVYEIDILPKLSEIVSDNIDFHAHVIVKWGVGMNLWTKTGNVLFAEKPDVFFRRSRDIGKQLKISCNWEIWKINEKFHKIGKLPTEYHNAEIGIVVSPNDIVKRMRTGQCTFVYPGY